MTGASMTYSECQFFTSIKLTYNQLHLHSDTEDAVDPLSAVPATPPLPTDKASLMRHMEKYDPLSLALARDWEDIAYQVLETGTAVKQYVSPLFPLFPWSD